MPDTVTLPKTFDEYNDTRKANFMRVKEFKEGREEGDRNTVDVTPEPPAPAKKDEKNEK